MINFVTERNVLGEDCEFDSSRFDVSKWDYIKKMFEGRNNYFNMKPIMFSMDFINGAFKPIRTTLTGMVIRDQEFQFVQYFKQIDVLVCTYDQEKNSYLITTIYNR